MSNKRNQTYETGSGVGDVGSHVVWGLDKVNNKNKIRVTVVHHGG